MRTLVEIAENLSRRLTRLFLPDAKGGRLSHGGVLQCATDPHWRDLVLLSEYFSGDQGRGVGTSHRTGWTVLAATLIRIRHTRRGIRNRAQ